MQKQKENSIQIALVQWAWLVHKVTLVHCPNQLFYLLNEGQKIYYRKMGVRIGWSDVMMFEPRGQYHGFIMELKSQGELPDENQFHWLNYLSQRGYYTCWHDNFDDASKAIENYLKLS